MNENGSRLLDNREDFPILKKDIIYFDNGATTLKPKVLPDAVNDYYNNYSANAHREIGRAHV